jgi:hypothetical protein
MAKSGTGREITLTADSKMAWIRVRDVAGEAKKLLLFLLFIHDFVLHITVIPFSFRFFLVIIVVVFVVVIIVVVFRDDIQMHRMNLHHFELGFTFRAIQDLALFDLILIEINLDGAFRAVHHSRTSWPSMALTQAYYITRGSQGGANRIHGHT